MFPHLLLFLRIVLNAPVSKNFRISSHFIAWLALTSALNISFILLTLWKTTQSSTSIISSRCAFIFYSFFSLSILRSHDADERGISFCSPTYDFISRSPRWRQNECNLSPLLTPPNRWAVFTTAVQAVYTRYYRSPYCLCFVQDFIIK